MLKINDKQINLLFKIVNVLQSNKANVDVSQRSNKRMVKTQVNDIKSQSELNAKEGQSKCRENVCVSNQGHFCCSSQTTKVLITKKLTFLLEFMTRNLGKAKNNHREAKKTHF